jgi:hypothetical protein
MRRLEAKTVFSGLVTAYIYNNKIRNFLSQWGVCKLTCLLAGIPTSLCPSSVKATVEGVVLTPIRHVSDQWKGPDGPARLTFGVLDHTRVVSFHDSNARVCGSEIDSNNAVRKTI